MSGTATGAVRRRILVAWAVALALGCCAFRVAADAWSVLPAPHPLEELSYYPSGQMLRPAALGHAETAADLAWLRAVQYYGEHRHTDNRFVRMFHVFDILTTLSPSFIPAYVFGGFALAQEGQDFAQAERLMLKGLQANPRSGELAFKLGFLYFIRPGGRELNHAAEYFQLAHRLPDAPPAAARFAAYSRQQAGDLSVAYELWSEVRATSDNRYLREMADREMAKIRRAIETGQVDLARKKLTTPRVMFAN